MKAVIERQVGMLDARIGQRRSTLDTARRRINKVQHMRGIHCGNPGARGYPSQALRDRFAKTRLTEGVAFAKRVEQLPLETAEIVLAGSRGQAGTRTRPACRCPSIAPCNPIRKAERHGR